MTFPIEKSCTISKILHSSIRKDASFWLLNWFYARQHIKLTSLGFINESNLTVRSGINSSCFAKHIHSNS